MAARDGLSVIGQILASGLADDKADHRVDRPP